MRERERRESEGRERGQHHLRAFVVAVAIARPGPPPRPHTYHLEAAVVEEGEGVVAVLEQEQAHQGGKGVVGLARAFKAAHHLAQRRGAHLRGGGGVVCLDIRTHVYTRGMSRRGNDGAPGPRNERGGWCAWM